MYGATEMQGWRKSMEDACITQSLTSTKAGMIFYIITAPCLQTHFSTKSANIMKLIFHSISVSSSSDFQESFISYIIFRVTEFDI